MSDTLTPCPPGAMVDDVITIAGLYPRRSWFRRMLERMGLVAPPAPLRFRLTSISGGAYGFATFAEEPTSVRNVPPDDVQ